MPHVMEMNVGPPSLICEDCRGHGREDGGLPEKKAADKAIEALKSLCGIWEFPRASENLG